MYDVIMNKSMIIRRCLHRINEEYAGNPLNLHNYTKQDSIVLNLQRACEAAIDLAMHVVAEKKLGLPQNSKQAFSLLEQAGLLNKDLAARMKSMVGFRNIAVHDYQALNLIVVQRIIEEHLDDFLAFLTAIETAFEHPS